MAEPGVGCGKPDISLSALSARIEVCSAETDPALEQEKSSVRFATSHPRLGHAALTVRPAIGQWQFVPAAYRDFGASPYQRFEDEDDDEYEDDPRDGAPSPSSYTAYCLLITAY
jgi:hypothetical protein